jgi:hypothetical protein
MIEWILEHLGIVVVVVLFLSQIIRGVMQQSRKSPPPDVGRDDGNEERRVREVQEQIRRQIAARRAGQPTADTPPSLARTEEPRPVPRAETTQMPEPFGGPLGRMLEELQRKAQPQHVPEPPPLVIERRNAAELERQQRLADEMKVLQEAKLIAARRATHLAEDRQALAQSEPALRTGARARLLADLSDAQSLRRAFVLREVLGAPLGLR